MLGGIFIVRLFIWAESWLRRKLQLLLKKKQTEGAIVRLLVAISDIVWVARAPSLLRKKKPYSTFRASISKWIMEACSDSSGVFRLFPG